MKEQLIENLLSLGVSSQQIEIFLKTYTEEKLNAYYEVVNFKKNVKKEKGIRNWAAFFVKQLKDGIDISISKREMERYYHQQQNIEEQKKIEYQEAINKKQERQDFLKDCEKMKELCEQLSLLEKDLMIQRIDRYIEKEYGEIKYGIKTIREIEIIKTFKKYNWDIEIIKERLK